MRVEGYAAARVSAAAPATPLRDFIVPGTAGLGAVRYASAAARDALRLALTQQGTRIIAVRHGQSQANGANHVSGSAVLCGASESPLSPTGREQANSAADRLLASLGDGPWLARAALQPERLPIIFASPLSRAHDTARAFVRRLHRELDSLVRLGELDTATAARAKARLVVSVDARLREMSFGDLELKTIDGARQAQPRLMATWESITGPGVNFAERFPNGECRLDVMARVSSFLHDVRNSHARRTVLCFSHLETMVALHARLGLTASTTAGDLRANGAAFTNATPMVFCGS